MDGLYGRRIKRAYTRHRQGYVQLANVVLCHHDSLEHIRQGLVAWGDCTIYPSLQTLQMHFLINGLNVPIYFIDTVINQLANVVLCHHDSLEHIRQGLVAWEIALSIHLFKLYRCTF
ncbi:hypothetical protein CEXT_586991 [Caerostris extrusa]|uniref:Uncharacterized protein n=1 Tax=Caerostris extrusa TaxID=172846 RepID=A0AAV4WJZ8_CAEEX|nr:hypothetical protein CEXT_586991 [Caerostris extrusa]